MLALLVVLTVLGAVAARASADPLPVDPLDDAEDAEADLADSLGELPDLLPEGPTDRAGFAAGAAPSEDPSDRRGSPRGRLELSAAWLRHDTLTAQLGSEAVRRVDELWLLLAWRR